MRILRPKTRSEEVAVVQTELRRLGFTIADPEGLFGATTLSAVRRLPRENGLPGDTRVIDERTLDVLNRAVETKAGGGGWARHNLDRPAQQINVRNPILTPDRDGNLAVFVQGTDGNLWTRRRSESSGDWHHLDAPTHTEVGFLSAAAGKNQDGRLEAFVVQGDEPRHTEETQ
jgi:peptidoglycan hydrolase-like protein with peptidoglycan-binding domain